MPAQRPAGKEFLTLGKNYGDLGEFKGWGYRCEAGKADMRYLIFEHCCGKKSELSPDEVLNKINKRLSI
jgi:hypothetical protein